MSAELLQQVIAVACIFREAEVHQQAAESVISALAEQPEFAEITS
jgi:hypothetical protein